MIKSQLYKIIALFGKQARTCRVNEWVYLNAFIALVKIHVYASPKFNQIRCQRVKRRGRYQRQRAIHACRRDSSPARHVKYERTAEKYDGEEEERRVQGSESYLLSYLRVLGRPLCRAAKMAKKISRDTREYAKPRFAISAASSSCG